MIRIIATVVVLACAFALPARAGAPDYDTAMTPYHTAFDAALNDMAAANRLTLVHDRAGACMALSAAVTDFGNAATALDAVLGALARDTNLDEAKRAGLSAQTQQARDVAQQNADDARAYHDQLCQ